MTHTRTSIFSTALLALAATTSAALAQGVASDAPRSQSANNNVQASSAGDYRSSTTEGMADRLFNVNSDSVDLENGSLQWKGKTFTPANAKFMRARLDRYFKAPAPTSDMKKYEATLEEIERLLSPRNLTQANYAASLQRAWNLLYEAAKHKDADGDCSSTLATLVHKTAQMRRELYDREQAELALKGKKNADLHTLTGHKTSIEREKEAREREDRIRANSKTGKGTAPVQSDKGAARTIELTEFLAESRKDILTNAAEYQTIGLRARLEFQSQIVSYIAQRRWHHVTIACAFYRNMFKGGAQDLRVGDKQMKEIVPISNFVPSIDSVDALAKEAINDVSVGIKTVKQLYDSGERFAAFERMQETFFLGEYEPAVMFFDPAKKRVLSEIWSNCRDLQKLGDERDLGGCEELLNKIKALANDFPSVQILSKVNGAKQASDLALLDAQVAAIQKKTEETGAKLEIARRIWPTNPGLKDFATKLRDQASLYEMKKTRFDDLYSTGQFREIFRDRMAMATAFIGDKERAAKLETIVNKIAQIDMMLANAAILDQQRNTNMAWDVLLEAVKIDPNDTEVMKARVALVAKVKDYSERLDRAESLEKVGHYAAALNAYLSAQELNQPSTICQKGIDRVSTLLLAKIAGPQQQQPVIDLTAGAALPPAPAEQ